jgi:tetratricopeptide (TPR) repeat protein
VKAPADITDASFTVRQLSPAEAAAVAGDFYVRTQRPVEAKARLEEAMQLDPSLAAPRESMGMLCQMENKLDEAMQWFSEAVQRDSKSFLAHYYHAMLASQGVLTPERRQIAESGLRRTIELNPRFAPAYSTLAHFYLAGESRLPEALELARKAIQLEPGVLMHHLAEANVLLRMDRVADARKVAERILASARTPQDQLAAQALLNNLASYEAFLEERRRAEAEAARYAEEARQRAESEKQASEAQEESTPQSRGARKPGDSSPSRSGPVTPGEGRVVNVTCSGFAMDMTLEYLGDRFTLHAENYFKVEYLTTRWQPPPHFNPCEHLKGRQVNVEYRVVVGKPYAGEIVSLEVRR